ncbi:MAG: glycoside hydrolase family 105 protein [Anaeroplasmataceae bacterium]
MDYTIIDRYINKLIDMSAPGKPYWNIEVIRGGKAPSWNYIDGCMTNSLLELYKLSGDKKIFDFVKSYIDYFVQEDGTINGYHLEKYSTDDMAESRVLFALYELTNEEKYKKAIENTYEQIKGQPRTNSGNFWHKKIYPNQIWLDGLYMAQPFYLLYETKFNSMKNYNDIIGQFKNVRKFMYDEKKHLYYHGYDESKKMFWADKKTGLSECFWLRAIGWYTVALVDCAEIINEQMYDEYRTLCSLFKEIIDGLLMYQDKETKMFYQVVDQGDREGNYVETSGSSMIAYSILKAVRMRILPERYLQIGLDIFNGICSKYLIEENGDLNLDGICLVAGLGPDDNRRRDGSYEYYISEPVVKNDAKGVGAFVMAYIEVKKYISSLE